MSFAKTEMSLIFEPPLQDGTPPPWHPATETLPPGQLVEVFSSKPGTNCKCQFGWVHDEKCPWSWGGWVRLVEGDFAGWWALADLPSDENESSWCELEAVTPLELLAREAEDEVEESDI